jgi:hypothetical protein
MSVKLPNTTRRREKVASNGQAPIRPPLYWLLAALPRACLYDIGDDGKPPLAMGAPGLLSL